MPYTPPDPFDADVSWAADSAYTPPDPFAADVNFSVDDEGGPVIGDVTGFMPVHFGTVTIAPQTGQIRSWRAARFGVSVTTGQVAPLRPVHFGYMVDIRILAPTTKQHGHVYRLRPVRFGTPT